MAHRSFAAITAVGSGPFISSVAAARGAIVFVVAAGDDLDVGGQAVVGHRGAIARSSVFCAGVVTAVDVGDGSVAETDEVVDGLPGADRVVVADDIDRASGDASTHFDDRYLVDERFEVAGVQFGADDDQACAAVAQQLVHHRVLSAAGGEGPRSRS